MPYKFSGYDTYNNSYSPNVPNSYQNNQQQITTVFVSGEEGANNYPVAAGNTVLLMDFNLNKFWLKSTAVNGVPMPVRSFSFNEEVIRNENPMLTNLEFVTKKEFDELRSYLETEFKSLKTPRRYVDNQRRQEGVKND